VPYRCARGGLRFPTIDIQRHSGKLPRFSAPAGAVRGFRDRASVGGAFPAMVRQMAKRVPSGSPRFGGDLLNWANGDWPAANAQAPTAGLGPLAGNIPDPGPRIPRFPSRHFWVPDLALRARPA
jgi:hypothetical protein